MFKREIVEYVEKSDGKKPFPTKAEFFVVKTTYLWIFTTYTNYYQMSDSLYVRKENGKMPLGYGIDLLLSNYKTHKKMDTFK